MSRTRRMTISVVVLACLMCVAALANAQTRRLTIHVNNAGASGVVRVVTGAVGACFLNAQCTYDVNAGATVRWRLTIQAAFRPEQDRRPPAR